MDEQAISFRCGSCGRGQQVPSRFAGRRGKCTCGQVLRVPQAETNHCVSCRREIWPGASRCGRCQQQPRGLLVTASATAVFGAGAALMIFASLLMAEEASRIRGILGLTLSVALFMTLQALTYGYNLLRTLLAYARGDEAPDLALDHQVDDRRTLFV
jgi:hypothetical protein